VSNDDRQAHPPTLVGATVLQIVPALREEPVARTALDVAAALRQAGARALVAAEEGPLVGELTAKRGRAWIASLAAARIPGGLVTTLLDVPPASGPRGYWAGAFTRGDWVISPSNFAAAPLVARHNIPPERLTIIPRSIDTAAFDPAVVDAARIETVRN